METNEASPTITFEDFVKVDIRSGHITKAELVPKSEKLLKLEIFFGPEIGHRTIMASLAKSYDVTMIVGLGVLAVVNLAPRKMMGVESHGMILAAYQEDGRLSLATCNGVPIGAKVG
jgi:methionyl-tRNA synthetase